MPCSRQENCFGRMDEGMIHNLVPMAGLRRAAREFNQLGAAQSPLNASNQNTSRYSNAGSLCSEKSRGSSGDAECANLMA